MGLKSEKKLGALVLWAMEEMLKFFPIAYLFSNAQVDEIDGTTAQSQEEPTTNNSQEQNSKTENNPKEKTKISLEPLEY